MSRIQAPGVKATAGPTLAVTPYRSLPHPALRAGPSPQQRAALPRSSGGHSFANMPIHAAGSAPQFFDGNAFSPSVAARAVSQSAQGQYPFGDRIAAETGGAINPHVVPSTVVSKLPGLGVCHGGKVALRQDAGIEVARHELAHALGADEATAYRAGRNPKVLTALGSGPPVDGWAVGFEFQSRIPPIFYNNDAPYGSGLIAYKDDVNHFHIENDHGDLEFVTDPPVAETADGYKQLCKTMDAMATAAENFEALAQRGPNQNSVRADEAAQLFGPNVQNTEVLEGVLQFYPDLTLRMPAQRLLAHPQTTGGLTLSALYDLMRRMTARTEQDGTEKQVENDGHTLSESLIFHGLNELGFSAKPARTYALRQQAAAYQAVEAYQPEQAISSDTRGFLSLVTAMIYGGRYMQNKQVQYVKDLLAVMPRSDFVRMFQSLSAQDQQWFRAGLADGSIGEALGWGRMTDRLIPTKLKQQSNEKHQDLNTITKRSWLEGVTRQQAPQDVVSMKNEGIGKVGTANLDQNGQLGINNALVNQQRRGAIVEMRAVRENVPPSEWAAMARAWFKTVVALNNPRGVRDMFPALKPQPQHYRNYQIPKWAINAHLPLRHV